MSEKALTLIFLNLGGEMLYVLDQRLYAQKIQTDKGKKIMQDIVSSMFSERFLDEIFKPQELCSRKALRTIFERLAHTSIMRLNESSMDKLYDLMTMAVKYQISLVASPREILLVTFNHLDSIIPFVSDSSNCVHCIEQCYKRVYKHFLMMNDAELQFVRLTMLNFFQDLKIKVSVFLKEKVQNWNGSFILFSEGAVTCGGQEPGTITYYENSEGKSVVAKESKFNPGARYLPAEREGSYERRGDRVTSLGLNVYSSNKTVDTIVPSERSGHRSANILSDLDSNVPDPRAKAQLDLLCKLIGKSDSSTASATSVDFKLNLFNNEEEEFIYNTQSSVVGYDLDSGGKSTHIAIDASKRQRDDRLNKVVNQFGAHGSNARRSNFDERDSGDTDVGGGRSARSKHSLDQKKLFGDHQHCHKTGAADDDDDDDIVAMMDRLNR